MTKTKYINRRTFVELMGKGFVTASMLPYISNCTPNTDAQFVLFEGINASDKDELVLASGLDSKVLIGFGDVISENDTFGADNDFLCFVPLNDEGNEGILWSNNEANTVLFTHGNTSKNKSKEEIDKEIYNVGGSLVHIIKKGESWEIVQDSEYNRRITGFTKIPFNWDSTIENSSEAMGTLGNCAGGLTPWGSILTCEENYHDCYGERSSNNRQISKSAYGWEKFYNNPPEHYGWVVEVDPLTGASQKHIALGRCAHECATVKELNDGRLVVYMGDDKVNECLYKFISSKPKSLKEGTLYVANIDQGIWIPIDIEQQPALKTKFNNQTDALIYLRESSRIVGGSRLDRPEDIEIDPVDGSVLVTLTNNKPKNNFFGSIMKIIEKDAKHDSLEFKAETFLAGGEENGFAAPDNLVFDRKGNLWFASDIAGSSMHKAPYKSFKNNGLFVVLREGPRAGEVIQMASAPIDAEFTGPWFSPDGKTLFLSVQHPGSGSKSLENLTSHWPGGGESIPKSSVVTISGSTLNKIQGIA